jgi:glycine/D-amino acid oxidase-like deaminating enzyme
VDLKSGYPFWAIKNGLMHAFPQLQENVRCDVAVIGGGISGALIANELANHGHEVALVEERDVGWGSSAASTALLQYEIDTPMIDLAKRYGEDDAALAYRACADAIHQLQSLAGDIRNVDFARMRSVY